MISQLQLIMLATVTMEIKSQPQGYRIFSPEYQNPKAENRLTCYTCPDKGDNQECNRWAPDKFCPEGYTVCETVHQFNHRTGASVSVEKRCAKATECNIEFIGCQRVHHTHHKHLTECHSCCTESYCNRGVPYNMTTALELSLSLLRTDSNSGSSCDNFWPTTVVVAVTWFILR